MPTGDPATYDPNAAMAGATDRQQRREEIDRLRAELDQAAEEEMEAARYKTPPMIIRAYQDVYGRFPLGWVNF